MLLILGKGFKRGLSPLSFGIVLAEEIYLWQKVNFFPYTCELNMCQDFDGNSSDRFRLLMYASLSIK